MINRIKGNIRYGKTLKLTSNLYKKMKQLKSTRFCLNCKQFKIFIYNHVIGQRFGLKKNKGLNNIQSEIDKEYNKRLKKLNDWKSVQYNYLKNEKSYS